ncbi:MAG TPA: PAS domain S-box protein [Thermoanaerobaculia bacterium]|nr:PAS domain S-box protein [Thermoanaerobaculia bacterium]
MTVDDREELAAALATLEAIRRGEVDALVINTTQGERVFTLVGADEAYRIIVEKMQQGAVTVSLDGTILYCNPRFAQMLRASKESLLGRPITDLVAPMVRERFAREMEASGESRTYFETAFERADGTILPVAVASSRVDFGPFKAWAAVVSDSAAQSAAVRHAMLASVGHRLLKAVDPVEEFGSICADLASVSGADRVRIICRIPHRVTHAGAPWPAADPEAIPPESAQKSAVLHDTAAPPEDLAALAAWYREEGIGSAVLVRINSGSRPACSIELTSDLPRLVPEWEVELAAAFAVMVEAALARQRANAEREELARELEAARRAAGLGNLASTLAHEFNNVLMAISPQADVIRRIAASDFAIGRACASIAQSVQRGKNVTYDILRFGRPLEIDPRPVALSEWLTRVAEAMSRSPQAIGFSSSIAAEIETAVLAIDASETADAVRRLAESGDPARLRERRVTLEAAAGNGGFVRFLLRHSTPVSAALDLSDLFDPFSTARSLNALSLAIARRIIEGHGGTIEAISDQGMLAFRFTLPLV